MTETSRANTPGRLSSYYCIALFWDFHSLKRIILRVGDPQGNNNRERCTYGHTLENTYGEDWRKRVGDWRAHVRPGQGFRSKVIGKSPSTFFEETRLKQFLVSRATTCVLTHQPLLKVQSLATTQSPHCRRALYKHPANHGST